MTAEASPALRTVAFGDLETGFWGAAWIADPGSSDFLAIGRDEAPAEPAFLAVGRGEHVITFSATVDGAAEAEDWRLRGDRAELVVSPAGEAVATATDDTAIHGFDQPCRVRGSFPLGEAQQQLDCPGQRTVRSGKLGTNRFESVRLVSAWFGPGEGFSAVAMRPPGSDGHESDLLTASVLAPAGAAPVADPRLSTTYGKDGRPTRVGLELWLAEVGSAEESEGPGAAEQFPRRAAGESAGGSARSRQGGLELQVELLRWHSEGRDGAGVYLLARRR